MDGSNIDFNKYKDRLKEIYPSYSNEELKKVLGYRVEFWEVIVGNYDSFEY